MFFLDTDIVHNQALVLSGIDTVDTGNCLNKGMLLDWLVDVNCVKCRYIKASQPHINDNCNFEVWI